VRYHFIEISDINILHLASIGLEVDLALLPELHPLHLQLPQPIMKLLLHTAVVVAVPAVGAMDAQVST
jgi:hypothetical protein